jgi:F-type H+-transporting ATPase subunit b
MQYDREEGIKNALLSAENARKKCKTFRLTINVFYKKQEWSDNMLKDAREIKEKMIADSKDEAQAQV